ncbi:hypothetical protein [Flavobacterium hydatis]|jgi:hypothetical protein|uniref:Uncharacterized protein n=1 Tax=Flavobacterium hydatis TaxID=991 RepID=A0A086AIL1_FLAHY|nr:hypothetical protein [Flavobacterium hydatis]KFF16525.1 hypothetical protein IW20_10145 [Flavobacterium hydatis]OXA93922.1 hypothetical protein B0A62_12270 [Flavobacterium hydatis]
MSRTDLSNWVIHFVHNVNTNNQSIESSFICGDDQYAIPDGFTYDGKPIRITEKYQEDDYGLPDEACAFEVLKKILHDGVIRAGWSFRSGNPTIYGSKAAACFTEMPLYALIDYAKKRNAEGYVEPYGIAFVKHELFEAGARPVIYGLSVPPKEAVAGDPNFGIGLRSLAAECGIGSKEMYRYVYTKLTRNKSVNWMHEREWRWADVAEEFEFFGMPFYALNEQTKFTKVIIIVKTKYESKEILEHLINLLHSRTTNFDREYDLKLISNTYVLAIDELEGLTNDTASVNLDDLPLSRVPKLPKITVSSEMSERVKEAVRAAELICYEVSKQYFEQYGEKDICGNCTIVTSIPNTEITQALIDLEIANSYAKGDYSFYLKTYPTQALTAKEKGYTAAAEYLTKTLGQKFTMESSWD